MAGAELDLGHVRVARQASGVGGMSLVGRRTVSDSSYESGLSYHSHLERC